MQSLDWKIWLRNRVIIILSMPTWPNCFSQNFCWIKFEIRLSACFPVLMNSRQFAECRSFQNGGMDCLGPASICLVTVRPSWLPGVLPLVLNLTGPFTSLMERYRLRQGRTRPRLCQTNRAYRKLPDSFSRKLNLPLIYLDPSIFVCLFCFVLPYADFFRRKGLHLLQTG